VVGLGLDAIDLLVASVAKAIRDRTTRGHAAECEKARWGPDDAAVGHAPGTPRREAAALRQTAQVGRAAGDRVYIAIARLAVHSRSKEAGGGHPVRLRIRFIDVSRFDFSNIELDRLDEETRLWERSEQTRQPLQ
jgi:hypothetical protein